ncbi:hypothetical protein P3T37_000387 [Kitasatospora sp. MAA4]|nr:type IV toxin-antitoxin system AbiEi family antitoxin domain-containing protein [Kitasatospora sp. MAA4]MDH6131020.1 hypothetical protein [Kitasatospora sp. MAA4]
MSYYFTLWRQDGLDQRIQEILRCQVRERAGRLEDPSLVIIDTQSVRVAAGVPKETTGLDANNDRHRRQGHRRPHPARPRTGPGGDRHLYQRIVTAFNEHPGRVFRVRDLHELLGLPTDEPSINVTRSRLGRLVRQGLLDQPGRGRYQKRT